MKILNSHNPRQIFDLIKDLCSRTNYYYYFSENCFYLSNYVGFQIPIGDYSNGLFTYKDFIEIEYTGIVKINYYQKYSVIPEIQSMNYIVDQTFIYSTNECDQTTSIDDIIMNLPIYIKSHYIMKDSNILIESKSIYRELQLNSILNDRITK